jgi:hypothetical protein
MAELVTVEIAGVSFTVSCSVPISLAPYDPSYKTFTRQDRAADGLNIDVMLELGAVPATEGMEKIFDGGQSWELFLDGTDYFLSLGHVNSSVGPVWVARFKRDIREVVVYCSAVIVEKKDGLIRVLNPLSYPLDQILLMHALLQRKGVIIHAAGIEIGQRGYIFPGRSGAGKSTLSRQFLAKGYGNVLSDDRIAVRSIYGGFIAFGTPWPGEGRIAANGMAGLRGIFFISHAAPGGSERIEEIGRREAVERLLPLVSVPWYDGELSEKALAFCEDLVSRVPSYALFFRPGTEVVDFFEGRIAGRMI